MRCGVAAASERAANCAFRHFEVIGPIDYKPLLAKGTLTYDASKGTACLAGIEATGCDQAFVAFRSAAFRQFLRGTFAVGGACSVDVECAGGFCQGRSPAGGPGSICVAYAKRGDPCAGNNPDCDPATDYCTVDGTPANPAVDTTGVIGRPSKGVPGASILGPTARKRA